MENWDKLEYDFGTIKPGITLATSFNFQGKKEIKEIEPTCNCVSYRWASNVLKLQWKVRNYTRDTNSIKNVLVLYTDGSFDDLTLKAFIKV